MNCIHCNSHEYVKNGYYVKVDNTLIHRYKCKNCGKTWTENANLITTSKFSPSNNLNGEKFVITSCQNNTPTNKEFLGSLIKYCEVNDARLIVIPTFYQEVLYPALDWDIDTQYIINEKFSLNDLVNVIADIKITASAENPLGGLDTLSKGKTLIVPHNQLQMRSLPVQVNEPPVMLCTTGTISEPNYIRSKSGEKAEFNHSYSAIFLEFQDDIFHLRVLNADENNGFYDINGYYTQYDTYPIVDTLALVLGDEHVIVNDSSVANATFFDADSIVNTLKPISLIRHDVLDCFTISHHHRKDSFIQYSKFKLGRNKIEDEMKTTLQYLKKTTPPFSKSYIVSSNHHDHLKRWLNEADPKIEPWNAKIYHELTYLMLLDIECHSTLHVPNPFELYSINRGYDFEFIGRNETFKICDIELSNHGDKGANGSRGSMNQFAKLAEKMIIGHSHTPGINKGAYSVGTSTPKDLEYVSGPSSWMNTHCVIYPNGKRQLINIINGKWK